MNENLHYDHDNDEGENRVGSKVFEMFVDEIEGEYEYDDCDNNPESPRVPANRSGNIFQHNRTPLR